MKKLIILISIILILFCKSSYAQSQLPLCQGLITWKWDNCWGTNRFENKDFYSGEYRNGKFNGFGTYSFFKGEKYVGGWKDGWFHGRGIYTFIDNAYCGNKQGFSADKEGVWADGLFVRAEEISELSFVKKECEELKRREAEEKKARAQEEVEQKKREAKEKATRHSDVFSDAKKKCSELGFKSGTEGLGNCVLKLSK